MAEELQDLYERAREALNARRKDVQKVEHAGAGDLDTAAFRYSVETGQNPEDPAEYVIRRRLELRQGWAEHRAAIDEIFGNEFDRLVIEFESMDDTFDDLVDKLEDIQDSQGGKVDDDDRTKRATYTRDGVTFTFDLKQRRLEISLDGQEPSSLWTPHSAFNSAPAGRAQCCPPRPGRQTRSRRRGEAK